jgi:hypothetical protein
MDRAKDFKALIDGSPHLISSDVASITSPCFEKRPCHQVALFAPI